MNGLTITWIIVGIVGAGFLGMWLFTDRTFSFTFSITAFLYASCAGLLYLSNIEGFGITSVLFLGMLHLYIYDRQFIHNKIVRRRL